ncbi:hypothetical protein NC652_012429 [Populus alba x Populus x berolinensis]|nr:hypothetical protein NC652_012429 [Populus alba x Populus x berolinensis]
MTNNNNNNNNNKDAAVIPDRPMSIQKQPAVLEEASTIKRRLSPHQGQTVQRSTVETGGPSSVSGLPGRQELKLCCCYWSGWRGVVLEKTIWKGLLFGHMRAHPDRGWRGAFPPPQWSPEKPNDQQGDQKALRSQLAPRLLNLAIGTLNQMKQDRGHEASGSSTNRRNFDLNTEPTESIRK